MPAEMDSQLKIRVSPELRSQLEAAAAERGMSLSKAITEALRASVEHRRFNPKKPTFGILRVIEEAMDAAGESALFEQTHSWEISKQKNWVEDATAYDRAADAAIAVLRAFRPAGKVSNPPATPWDGAFWSDFYLKQAATGEPNVPENLALAQDLRASVGDRLAQRVLAHVSKCPSKREKP